MNKPTTIRKNQLSAWLKKILKPNTNRQSSSLFFDKNGNQKKWFIVSSILLPLILTIIFSVWGTAISVKSYELSVETAKNREQIDSTKVIIDEIRVQNKLLISQNSLLGTQIKQLSDLVGLNRTSTDIQGKHLETVISDLTNYNTPKLSANLSKTESLGEGEFTYGLDYYIQISNNGGDIYNFRCASIDTSVFDISNFPKGGTLPRNSYFEFDFLAYDVENKQTLCFYYEDMYHKKYSQDLKIYINGNKNIHSIQMSKPKLR